jgi:ribosomal protein L7/L12
MSASNALQGQEFEYVCLHGHAMTPAAMLRIRQLEREVQSLKAKLADRHSTACDLVRSDGTRCSCDAAHNTAVYADPAAGKMEQVLQLLMQNKLFDAAKLYRSIHGCGLREAHTACEALRNQSKYA